MDVYPVLTFRNVGTALAWLSRAFGLDARIENGGDHDVGHAVLIHHNGLVLAEAERPDELYGTHTGRGWLYVAVDDVDAHYARAKSAGAELLSDPHDAEGLRGYSARDIEGNLWTFGSARPAP